MTTPSSFKPRPHDTLVLFGQPLEFPQHPSAKIQMPNAAEGGRATVYELRDPTGRRLALKVFRSHFREPGLAQSGVRLTGLRSLPGMDAAQRDVVLPGDEAVRRFPDLEYALLMPWIDGETWAEVMMQAAATNVPLPRETAIHLCTRFLSVVRALEMAGASHTDLAGGNVVVQKNTIGVQLLDLEDMYLPGAPPPLNPRPGSPGYQHRSREPVFCPQGDRYAAAVLAAEILALADPALTELGSDAGMFAACHGDPVGDAAYARVDRWLRQLAPEFASVFWRSWHARSLAECPTVAELHEAVHPLAAVTPPPTPKFTSPTKVEVPVHEKVIWSPRVASPAVAPRPATLSAPPPSLGTVQWNGMEPSSVISPTPQHPVPPPRTAGGEIPTWLIVALAAIFAVLLAVVLVNAR